jgi:hypothetical protein
MSRVNPLANAPTIAAPTGIIQTPLPPAKVAKAGGAAL